MAKDHIWQPGQPHKFVPSGNIDEASKWLGVARRRLAVLAQQGDFVKQQFSPVDGVTIDINTLRDIPRIMIEAGDLVFTAGFELDAQGNEKLHVNMAADYDKPFSTRLTVKPEPGFGTQGPFVDRFYNLGEGQGIFIEGANSGQSLIYVVNNHPPAFAKVIGVLTNIPIGSRTLVYIGKYDGAKRLISMSHENTDPAKPQVLIFGTDSLIFGQGLFPLHHETLPFTDVEPTYFVGNRTLVAAVKFWSNTQELYILARSTDGGFNWSANAVDGLKLLLDDYGEWDKLRMTPLSGGRVLATGIGDPTFGSGPNKVLAFMSSDRGASFNAISTISDFTANHPHFDPVALGDGAAVLMGADNDRNAIVYRTLDGGSTWQNLGPIGALVSRVGNFELYVRGKDDPAKGILGVIVAHDGVMTLYISEDSGATWVPGQKTATAPLRTHFNRVVRIGTKSHPMPANPALPDLHENAPPMP